MEFDPVGSSLNIPHLQNALYYPKDNESTESKQDKSRLCVEISSQVGTAVLCNFPLKTDIIQKTGILIKSADVKKFIVRMKTENSVLFELLSNKVWEMKSKQILEQRQVSYEIASVTIEQLQCNARRYSEKYGILLDVVVGNQEVLVEKLENELLNLSPRYLGLIYYSNVGTHVCPLLLRVDSNGPRALVLDLADAENSFDVSKKSIAGFKALQIPYRLSHSQRQVDSYSCRTGALVILRNALLDLMFQKDVPEIFGGVGSFKLPAQWGFTDQISEINKADEEILNPRQLYQSKSSKKIETIKAFRDRHRRNLQFVFEFTLPRSSETLNLKLNNLNLPEDVKVKAYVKGQIGFKWSACKEVNGYMLYKGRRYAGLTT